MSESENTESTEAANEAIRKHARLFDIAAQAVIGTTVEGRIVYWSDRAVSLYGWTASEVVGQNIVDITPAEIAQEPR